MPKADRAAAIGGKDRPGIPKRIASQLDGAEALAGGRFPGSQRVVADGNDALACRIEADGTSERVLRILGGKALAGRGIPLVKLAATHDEALAIGVKRFGPGQLAEQVGNRLPGCDVPTITFIALV